MHKLNARQKAFADYYIESLNASDAARRAGYSPKTAAAIGVENLQKPNIRAYIDDKLKKLEEARTMDLAEALRRVTAIARRDVHESHTVQVDNTTGEVLKDVRTSFRPSIEEAQKSLEHIIRVYGGFIDKQELQADVELNIKVDYGDD